MTKTFEEKLQNQFWRNYLIKHRQVAAHLNRYVNLDEHIVTTIVLTDPTKTVKLTNMKNEGNRMKTIAEKRKTVHGNPIDVKQNMYFLGS